MAETGKLASVDLADILNEDEEFSQDLNAEASVYGFPPPPPDGIHVVSLELSKSGKSPTGVDKGVDKNGNKYLRVQVVARVIAPGEPYDDRVVFAKPTTIVMPQTGGCAIATYLNKLGEKVNPRVTKGELTQQLVDILAGKPKCRVRTRWELRVQQADGSWKTELKGMRRFPQRSDGSYEHIVGGVSASAEVIDVLSLEG